MLVIMLYGLVILLKIYYIDKNMKRAATNIEKSIVSLATYLLLLHT